MRNLFRIIFMTILSVCMLVSFTGCRQSLVIAKILHDQQIEEQDEDTEMRLAENDEDSNDEDEQLEKQQITQATRTSDQTRQARQQGDQHRDGKASKTVHDSKSSNQSKADRSGSNQGDDDANSNHKKNTGGSGNSGGGGESSGQGGDRQIYDDDGNVVDLPEEVHSVIAAGDAAIIAQMLGGSNVLAGTSANVVSNTLAQSVFGDEGISSAQAYWDGDGSGPMSAANFDVLLANQPDVCIASGGKGSFSDAQIAKLKKNHIAYVSIPALDSPAHIEKAVSIVGKMLGDRSSSGGVNAKSLAADYVDYCDDLTSEVSRAVGNSADSCYSLYVVGWDEAATFSIPEVGFQEYGVAYTSNSVRPITSYLQIGGVTDNMTSYQMSAATDYAVIPLNVNVENNVSVSNGLSMLRKTDNNSFVRNAFASLGEPTFQWVITDSQFTRDCIDYSRSTGGMWTSFSRVTATQGGTSVTDWGFLANNRIVRSNVRGSYQIAVNPCGVGSWANGSPESILECIWAAWRIAGVYNESDVKNEIKNFYHTFYRCDLTSSQVNAILAGMQ